MSSSGHTIGDELTDFSVIIVRDIDLELIDKVNTQLESLNIKQLHY